MILGLVGCIPMALTQGFSGTVASEGWNCFKVFFSGSHI